MNCPCCHSLQTSLCITCQTCHHILRIAQLRVLHPHGADQTVALPQRDFTIGRQADNDLVLAVEGVSRRHVRFCFIEGIYHIEDCGSKNGLLVNGQKVDRKKLQDQDCLQIGRTQLFFSLTENIAAAAESASRNFPQQSRGPAGPVAASDPKEEKWLEFLGQHLLRGALHVSRAKRASLWLPSIAGELGWQRQIEVGEEHFTRFSHEQWRPLAQMILFSGSVVLREHAEVTNRVWEGSLLAMDCAYHILGVPLRVQERQGAPAGVLLLENANARGGLAKQEAQQLQKLVEQAAACLSKISGTAVFQQNSENGADGSVPRGLSGEEVQTFAALHYDIAYASRPSGTVGGDCLDLIAINETELVFAIGDVAGKGAVAGKMRDCLLACLRLHLIYETRLEVLVQALNQFVYESGSAAVFTTLFLGILNRQRSVMRYVNAGHNPGVMIHPPTATPRFELLRSNGAALGVLEKNPIAEKEIAIPTAATLIFYTDGVTEATGADDKQYGLTRLIECATAGIFSTKNSTASHLLRLVLEDLPYSAALAAGISQPEDDQSVLVMIARA